ncbi:MAG: hypothetical protein LKJ91_04340 [Acidaminococcus sp.]|nr:hypothetical protein [Acidaminococcus sp.]MCI2114536.1 hypothetical protein [Acidaminococcus sp.]
MLTAIGYLPFKTAGRASLVAGRHWRRQTDKQFAVKKKLPAIRILSQESAKAAVRTGVLTTLHYPLPTFFFLREAPQLFYDTETLYHTSCIQNTQYAK